MVELYSLMKDEPDVRQYELKKRVFDAYGVKDVEKLLKSEEEVQQEQLEQMQQEDGWRRDATGRDDAAGRNTTSAGSGTRWLW